MKKMHLFLAIVIAGVIAILLSLVSQMPAITSPVGEYYVQPRQQETHSECVDLYCTSVPGKGPDKCVRNSDCAHSECVGAACTAVKGPGKDECSHQSDCGHSACNNNLACEKVPGKGEDQCNVNTDCYQQCSLNGQSTQSYSWDVCGACTNDRSPCKGQKKGSACEFKLNGNNVYGKCVSEGLCTKGNSGYEGQCGQKCACRRQSKEISSSLPIL